MEPHRFPGQSPSVQHAAGTAVTAGDLVPELLNDLRALHLPPARHHLTGRGDMDTGLPNMAAISSGSPELVLLSALR